MSVILKDTTWQEACTHASFPSIIFSFAPFKIGRCLLQANVTRSQGWLRFTLKFLESFRALLLQDDILSRLASYRRIISDERWMRQGGEEKSMDVPGEITWFPRECSRVGSSLFHRSPSPISLASFFSPLLSFSHLFRRGKSVLELATRFTVLAWLVEKPRVSSRLTLPWKQRRSRDARDARDFGRIEGLVKGQ